MVRWAAVLLLVAGSAGAAWAAQGIRGRAAQGGVLVEAVTVRAYPYRAGGFGPLTGEAPVGTAPTATDGTYEIPLPPGRYVVEALRQAPGAKGSRPQAGDLHCLYSGSPVTVAPGAWTAVGLNLTEAPREARKPAPRPGIVGRITAGGAPVEKVYLYVYADLASAFRGPAQLVQPVAKGEFQVRLPPGTYYLVARKRVRGGAYGPIDIGDLFNFYPGNPVVLRAGEEVRVEIPLIERLSQLEEDPGAFQGATVLVKGPGGAPTPGYRVLAYPTAARSGHPLVVSSPTDELGRARLPLPPGQRAYLRVRRTLGGPLEAGELFGDGEVPEKPGAEIPVRLQVTP